MGGGDAHYYYNSGLGREEHRETFAALERYFRAVFPSLQNVSVASRWGGPISGTLDMVPAVGTLGRGRRIAYAVGCMGHGVSFMPKAGQILRDLILERDTDLTRLFFVNRRILPLPPEPLRLLVAQTILTAMRFLDRRDERR